MRTSIYFDFVFTFAVCYLNLLLIIFPANNKCNRINSIHLFFILS